MIKDYGALMLFAMLITISGGQDYLDGGYVGSGDYSDVGQYFTDPIFYSTSGHYTSSDPAISEMQESMDRYGGGAALGSAARKSTIHKATAVGKAAKNTAPVSIAGRWHLELSEGRSIDLDLSQIGERIFGHGSIASGMAFQTVTASGYMSGSNMILDVVEEGGNGLYSISIDVSRLHLASPYTVFRTEGGTKSGTLRAFRIAPAVAAKGTIHTGRYQ